jgi:hypothetical protein
MIDRNILRDDFAELIAEMPVTASYAGITVSAALDEQTREDGMEMTGLSVPKATTLYLPTTNAAPAERTRVDIRFTPSSPWEQWRAVSVVTSPDRIHYAVTLARWNRT